MKKKLFKFVSLIITPILILVLVSNFMVKRTNYLYENEDEYKMTFMSQENLNNEKDKDSSLRTKFLGLISLNTMQNNKSKDIELVPGGNSIGIRLSSNGALVVGYSDLNYSDDTVMSPAEKSGINVGDLIVEIDGKNIESSKDLIKVIKECNKESVNIKLIRNKDEMTKEVKLLKESNGEYKLGLWVRDSTAGVGTMTFYDNKTGKFAALGHPVTDSDTNKPFVVKEGDLLESSIISVRKGEKGSPGELKGIFVDDNKSIGKITKNTQCGIFGESNNELNKNMRSEKMKVGFRDEIQLGKASIITTIDENGPKEYEIEIVKLLEQDEPGPKSMVIKVVDEELLEKTGGIVQGMSGSPIIQNNKIIGAVTHVLINKPDVGYGIYIDWMLQDAEVIK